MSFLPHQNIKTKGSALNKNYSGLYTLFNGEPVGTYYLHVMPMGMVGKAARDTMQYVAVGNDKQEAVSAFWNAVVVAYNNRRPIHHPSVQLLRIDADVRISGRLRDRGPKQIMSWTTRVNHNFPDVSGPKFYFDAEAVMRPRPGGMVDVMEDLRTTYKPLPCQIAVKMGLA